MKKVIDTTLREYLRRDAKLIRDTRAEVKKAKDMYKPEVAVEIVKKEVSGIIKQRETHKDIINNIVEREFERLQKAQESKYTDKVYQTTLSNVLKVIELSNGDIEVEGFKKLIKPLLDKKDNDMVGIIGGILNTKEKFNLSQYCKENSINKDFEAETKMLNAIKEYINTDILKSVGGDPVKFKNSSYEEIYLLAEELGFDISDMGKEYGGQNSILDTNAFMERKFNIEAGLEVEEPLFNIDDRSELEKIVDENLENVTGIVAI